MELAQGLLAYKVVFGGIDEPIELGTGKAPPQDSSWYVSYEDRRLNDESLRPMLEQIRRQEYPGLSLAGCASITAAGFRSLGTLAHLQTLDLFNTSMDDSSLQGLSSLAQLRSLNLAGTRISNQGLAELIRLPRLEQLHLGWTDIDDVGLRHLASATRLRWLDLRRTRITDSGLRSLANITTLENLCVEQTQIGDAGIEALLPLCKTLLRLNVAYTGLTDRCIDTLCRFQKLRALTVRATKITRDRDDALMAALPELGVSRRGPLGIQEGLIR